MRPSIRQSKLTQVSSAVGLLDRDHSILAVNERVLDWGYRVDVPLLERLRLLCIVSSNLDEFFEVRAEPHLAANQNKDEKGLYSVESFNRLAVAAHTLVARQYALYNDGSMPALQQRGIKRVQDGERNVEQRRGVKRWVGGGRGHWGGGFVVWVVSGMR